MTDIERNKTNMFNFFTIFSTYKFLQMNIFFIIELDDIFQTSKEIGKKKFQFQVNIFDY